jgi:YbbR domain-containing protein
MSARDAILQNFWLKLFSLVLATMIWFAIFGTQTNLRPDRPVLGTVTRTFERVPITVMKSASDLRAFRVEPATVEVTVSGPLAKVQVLTPAQVEVFISLTDVSDTVGMTKKILIHVPTDIALRNVSPTEARITPVAPIPTQSPQP